MAISETQLKEKFIQHVDSQLDRHRIDSYSPGDKWLDDVVDTIDTRHLSDKEIRRLYVSTVVKKREAEATKSVTNLFKRMAESGQRPLDWFQYSSKPMAYTIQVPNKDGDLVNRERRVALRAATSEDFLAWALWREEQAKKSYDAEMKNIDVARGLAHEMELGGFRTFTDYGYAVLSKPVDVPENQVL
ncbi:hypothetical protein phi16_gp043 [Corynebacterium phage phi16]|uniref:hypothetical protein n=1 Tax=Corynebacterium glutamicum TaxID=1718 RepID=UPI0009445710|nr:hypothetical protein [Corynebacterium glutamicum]APQ42546.1 hypothetical protein phi16_gp043 [Corynebacterium phage phi16]OKX80548.1 hypothetical protein AUO95_10410 [Corynebacterium glutamicum]